MLLVQAAWEDPTNYANIQLILLAMTEVDGWIEICL